MRNAIALILAMLMTACAVAQAPRLREVRAPPGWQPFCFPLGVRFVGGADAIVEESRAFVRTVVDAQGFRSYRWFHLAVASGGAPGRTDPGALARRRAEAVLRMLAGLGIRADRVEVSFAPELPAFDDHGAYLTVMIPPERVEELRIAREARGIIAC